MLTRIVVWWSTFTALKGTVFSYASLLAARFLFGVGEAGAWPNVARTFSRWFPIHERSTVQGIFFMGAHAAGGLTPLLVTAILAHFQWRVAFVLFGSVGFVWAAAWYRWFRDSPAEHAAVGADERAYIESGAVVHARHFANTPWKRVLTNRTVIFLCLMYFTQTYGFYLYITWMPTYLRTARGFSSMLLGFVAGLPLMLSAVADVIGGITTDRAVRRFGLRIGRSAVGGLNWRIEEIGELGNWGIGELGI